MVTTGSRDDGIVEIGVRFSFGPPFLKGCCMKVRDLLTKLEQFNPEADVVVVAHSMLEEFSLSWGGDLDGEGAEKINTTRVSIYVDRLCQSESAS